MADPIDARTWFTQAQILVNQGRLEESVAHYDKGLEIEPDSWPSWNNRGTVLGRLWKWPEAVASFDRAIEIDPTRSESWFGKGLCFAEGLTNYPVAIEC